MISDERIYLVNVDTIHAIGMHFGKENRANISKWRYDTRESPANFLSVTTTRKVLSRERELMRDSRDAWEE